MDIEILTDPLSNQVHLPLKFNKLLIDANYFEKDLSTVILKPAMIIIPETKNLYHLRSIDWEITILLRSEWRERFWLVAECICNPASDLTAALIAKGNFVSF
jgi:hypothetical protein